MLPKNGANFQLTHIHTNLHGNWRRGKILSSNVAEIQNTCHDIEKSNAKRGEIGVVRGWCGGLLGQRNQSL